ncbi:hypothetical protein [Nocardioides nitrophenolicus]|uniref:hypothetical protein n=1 Tax=Nocardioides nitrophenolicus TaxID=60489 RepID=UPI001957A52E|nr:hypothetical protein [Nocardioides nitrophenolicus]MBM7515399.1 alpha-1,2-mannosyltransferase [Nocardioides nitrophenolicus]
MTGPHPSTARWAAPALFAALVVVYVATMGRALSFDVFAANLASWHIAETGSPFVDLTDFPKLNNWPTREIWIVEAADGRDVIGRSSGVIAAAVPAYRLAGLLGFHDMDTVPASVTAAVLTAAAVTLLYVVLRRRLAQREALLAALLFGLTTPVWSVAADGMWPHTVTVFGIMGMAWAADRERWWLVGVFGGITLWGRLHAAVICAVVGLLLAWWRRSPAIAAKVAMTSGALLALTCLWSHWMYGTWSPTAAYRIGDFTANVEQSPVDVVNQLGLWISPGRGMLWWTPLLLVLGFALVRGWRDLPDWSRALVVGGAGYTLAQLMLNRYTGGGSFFGYRIGLEMLACLTPALALSAHRMGRVARRLFAPVAVLQLAVFAAGAVSSPALFPDADDRWTRNEYLWWLGERPLFVGLVSGGAAVIGIVVWRMWTDPDLKRD